MAPGGRRWVDSDIVCISHVRPIEEHGGAGGLGDGGLIDSALARPINPSNHADPDAARLAAAYACGILIANEAHPATPEGSRIGDGLRTQSGTQSRGIMGTSTATGARLSSQRACYLDPNGIEFAVKQADAAKIMCDVASNPGARRIARGLVSASALHVVGSGSAHEPGHSRLGSFATAGIHDSIVVNSPVWHGIQVTQAFIIQVPFAIFRSCTHDFTPDDDSG